MEIPRIGGATKDDFSSGMAARVLRAYGDVPEDYLDERERAKLANISRDLWRRLEEALGENSEELVALRSRGLGDNSGDGPVTVDDLQKDLFADPYLPF